MYTHSRLTSESSNATNASGSTEQTDLSDETSDVECQRRNVHLSESVPLLIRSESEYAVRDLIRSEDFRKFFETEYADIVKFRKNYKSLRKSFLTLAVLNIILIICAVSVMSMSLRFGYGHVTSDKISLDAAMEELVLEKLDSPRAKAIIRQHASCDDCRHMNDKLEKCDTNIQKVWKSIDKLEDAVIALQPNGSNIKPGGFQRTAVEVNNQLINSNRKRSSMQLLGSFRRGQVEWKKDVSNGNIMAYNKNKGIHVMGGGTYFLYTKIKFSKNNCTGNE